MSRPSAVEEGIPDPVPSRQPPVGHLFTTGQSRPQWLRRLPELGRALAAQPEAGSWICHRLLELAWQWLAAEFDVCSSQTRPSEVRAHLALLGEPLAALLEACAVLSATDVRDQVLVDVRGRSDEMSVALLVALRAAAGLPIQLRDEALFPDLAADCANRLRARLSHPARAESDWSIGLSDSCTCDLCDQLRSFLQDRHRTSLDWPLAQARRQHVHSRIDRAELPVTHLTRRKGSPYTLVLTKTAALFTNERAARAQDQTDLDWLTAWRDAPGGRKTGGQQ